MLLTRYARTVDRDIIEDAVSDAVLDLVAYWQGLQSSQTATKQLNFGYALQRGVRFGAQSVLTEVRRREMFVATGGRDGFTAGNDSFGWTDDEMQGVDVLTSIADPSPGPEELACEADEVERVRRMLADMSGDELADCFELLEEGSTRELAERLGISHVAVQKRQRKAAARLRVRAENYGLVP